jgi:hypothetical protein
VSDLTENLKAMQAQRKEKETEINAKGDILKGLNKNIEELWKVAAFYNLFCSILVGWPRLRARALFATVFLDQVTGKVGRCVPPVPPIAGSLILPAIRNMKNPRK